MGWKDQEIDSSRETSGSFHENTEGVPTQRLKDLQF